MIFYAIFDEVPHLGPRVRCSWRVCIFQQKMHIYLILVIYFFIWPEFLQILVLSDFAKKVNY